MRSMKFKSSKIFNWIMKAATFWSLNAANCEIVFKCIIDVAILAHWLRSEDYSVELHFLKALNRKILWRKFWEWCETVYERVINVVTSAHEIRSEGYYVELHFLKALNCKILWKEFWEWKLCNVKIR